MKIEYPEFKTLTAEQAEAYCRGSESQPVRKYIAQLVGDRNVLDLCCGNGIDAEHYTTGQYLGLDFSARLLEAAQKLHPAHNFDLRDGRDLGGIDDVWPADVVMVKSALEHVASEADAVAIFSEALRVAREHVYVAWHTPPVFIPEPVIRRMSGHFGFEVNQNTYRREPFLNALAGRKFHVEKVGIFDLWVIEQPKRG